jgi:hypothetical protein
LQFVISPFSRWGLPERHVEGGDHIGGGRMRTPEKGAPAMTKAAIILAVGAGAFSRQGKRDLLIKGRPR